jgi:hypothetical protein
VSTACPACGHKQGNFEHLTGTCHCVTCADIKPQWQAAAAEEWAQFSATGPDRPQASPAAKGTSLRERLLSFHDLMKLPPAKPLIQDVIELESEAWLIGPPKGFKSFVAIDWACHVATGREWRGKVVHRGPVLYVAAEGGKGIRKRVAAWAKYHDAEPIDLYVLPSPVQAKGPAERWGDPTISSDWRQLIALAAELGAVMVVLDTQARMTVGLEENSATGMGLWIEAVRLLKEATRAAVLVVHHTGRSGTSARGSNSLDGAQDHEWRVARVGGDKALSMDIISEANKDGDDTGRFSVDLVEQEIGQLDDLGRSVTSLVLAGNAQRGGVARGPVTAGKALELAGAQISTRQWIVQVLRQMDVEGQGATRGDLLASIRELQKGQGAHPPLERGTFNTAVKRMLDQKPEPELFSIGTSRLTLQDPAAGTIGLM